jgi:hypothetical protein
MELICFSETSGSLGTAQKYNPDNRALQINYLHLSNNIGRTLTLGI